MGFDKPHVKYSTEARQLSVSVVIAAFNRPMHLRRAIHSALRSGLRNRDVIVVDDHSDDDPSEWLASEFPGITCLRLPENSGPNRARNAGLMAAKSEWVVILDDDDVLTPDALQVISGDLKKTPAIERFP